MKLFLLLVLYVVGTNAQKAVPGVQCDRMCNGVALECMYELTADRYYTVGPNCLNCQNGNYADCRREECIIGDGNPRSVKAFNGTIPGPPIIACEGDIMNVVVNCWLDPETCSIHWHGMHQKFSQAADGVPMVTQWPILPNERFTYRFVAAQAGTHFYHSHSGAQRADGLYGLMTIRKPIATEEYGKLYHFDLPEHHLSLLDFFPLMSDEWLTRYQRTSVFYDQDISSILVNGQGATATNRVPPYRVTVMQGRCYRVRITNAMNIVSPVEMSIDGHRMFVFNSDGNDFRGVTVDKLTITNGERYDFLLNATRPIAKYAIRFEGSLIGEGVRTIASLEYVGANAGQVLQHGRPAPGGVRLNCVTNRTESGCIPLHRLEAIKTVPLRQPTNYYLFTFDQELYARPRYRKGMRSGELYTPFINNIAHVAPKQPMINVRPPNICNFENPLNCDPQRRLCECTHVVEFKNSSYIEIVFADLGKDLELAHPMHIHGHSMQVLGTEQIGQSVTRQEMVDRTRTGNLIRNFTSPIMKDTIAVPDGGYVVVRVFADNPGNWLVHCHVDFHTEEGMQFVLRIV